MKFYQKESILPAPAPGNVAFLTILIQACDDWGEKCGFFGGVLDLPSLNVIAEIIALLQKMWIL